MAQNITSINLTQTRDREPAAIYPHKSLLGLWLHNRDEKLSFHLLLGVTGWRGMGGGGVMIAALC